MLSDSQAKAAFIQELKAVVAELENNNQK